MHRVIEGTTSRGRVHSTIIKRRPEVQDYSTPNCSVKSIVFKSFILNEENDRHQRIIIIRQMVPVLRSNHKKAQVRKCPGVGAWYSEL